MLYRNVSGDTDVLTTDALLNCSCTAAMKVTFDAVRNYKNSVTIKKSDAGSDAVTIVAAKNEYLEGGTYQVETTAVAGTITKSGNATIVVTAANVTGSPITISVPITAGESTSVMGARFRSYIEANAAIRDKYNVSGAGANIVLTQNQYLGNDSTLNISLDNDTSTGLTQDTSSTNTTAGVAVTLTTTNEFKTFAPTDNGWVVIDSYTASPTLTSPALNSPKLVTPLIDDGSLGITITSANQGHAAPTATIPNIGDAADEFVMKDTTQTLTKKMLTAPFLTDPCTTYNIGTHDYEEGVADWTLSQAEALKPVHKPTNAGGAVNAIVASSPIPYIFINATGAALTVKTAEGSGYAITAGKTAIVMSDGANVIALATESA